MDTPTPTPAPPVDPVLQVVIDGWAAMEPGPKALIADIFQYADIMPPDLCHDVRMRINAELHAKRMSLRRPGR